MVIIQPHTTAVSLFRRNGEVRIFASLSDALKQLGYAWICREVGKEFRVFSHTEELFSPTGCKRSRVYTTHDYVMRDDFGNALTALDFSDLHRLRTSGLPRNWSMLWWRKRRLSHLLLQWNGSGPVPGIHKHNAGHHCFRPIAHMNARRAAQSYKEDGEVPPRARRNAKNIPNPWDDYQVMSRQNHSWKRFRKTRWK